MNYKELEKINCPLCGTDSYSLYAEIKGLNYVRCSNCDLIYVNPRLSDSYTQEIYEGKTLKPVFKNFLYSRRKMKDLENIDNRMSRGEHRVAALPTTVCRDDGEAVLPRGSSRVILTRPLEFYIVSLPEGP